MIVQEVSNLITNGSYILVGVLIFFFGFLLVQRNLKKINLIEGEKFNISDWLAMIGFGLLFAAAILFILNITLEILPFGDFPNYAGYILCFMLVVLVIYPLWEVFFLGRPTSDSVHDFHRFLESKILDRFKGKMAYVISFVIFLVIYILPIVVLWQILGYDITQIAFMWFLIFPLFFLNYFAASGVASGIIKSTYIHTIPDKIITNSLGKKSSGKKIMNILWILAAWIPFLLNIYNLGNPILRIIQGYSLDQKDLLMGYVSLLTTVPFGIKGFFDKFWNRKSKTKTIDFLFAGYIFIAIAMNMLLSFLQINKEVVFQLFQTFPFLNSVGGIFNHYEILVPLIVVQSFITLVYGISALVKKNSDFQADVRLQATSEAFGIADLEDLIEIRKTHMHQLIEENIEDEEDRSNNKKQKSHLKKETKRLNKLRKKETKYNYQTLYKSLLLEPSYSTYGVDVNEQIRFKSEQYLLLIASESKENAQKIVNFVFKSSLSLSKQEIDEINYISEESIDLLGGIGALYPEIVLDRLIERLDKVAIFLQRQILDALGDIGEIKANMAEILSKIHPLFDHSRYEVRQAAFSAVTEMILEGNSEDKVVVNLALKYIYDVLEQKEKPEVIDSCLEAVVKMSARIGDDIDLDKIEPFLHYKIGNNQDTINYIQQNAIIILSYIVYYNSQKFPKLIPDLEVFLEDPRSFIRYVTADTLGNFILKGPQEFQEPILLKLMVKSLNDDDPDVTEMCTESVQEFLIVNKGYQVSIDGNKTSILDYYTNGLFSDKRMIAENSSEALKSISPLYDEDIYPILEKKIKEMKNLEVVRDCVHVIATSGEEEHLSTDLELVYSLTRHEESSVRAEAVFCLGNLAEHRPEIDEKILFKCLDDSDPQVRLEAIFALGKLGIKKPQQVSQVLIQKIFEIDRASEEKVSEIELYAESLGIIGSYYPSNEIIITLQSVLIGDTNPFAKDVIAHALGEIGNGMIRSGKATRRIESSEFYNQISWLRSSTKKEYTIGNLIIIFIEALQLKGIPASVMNEISDAIQDLLPVFLFTKVPGQKKDNILLETIKEMLAQAYYANYSSEILETIDRIDSMISFKRYFETNDKFLQQQFLFFAKQYTPDGKQFHDQGETFMVLNKTRKERKYLEYAFKSFEIAQELAPYDYFTPNVVLQQGKILIQLEKYSEAKNKFVEALEIFTSLDDVARMKECGEALEEIAKKQ